MKSHIYIMFCIYLRIGTLMALPIQADNELLKILADEKGTHVDCIHMESVPGQYYYTSDGKSKVCGMFIIGQTDQLIAIEFEKFDIDCSHSGVLEVFDGWEIEHNIFPSELDHPKSLTERYQSFCGSKKPNKIIITSQNVGVIQFRVPIAGAGFRINLQFIKNPVPCNIVSLPSSGTYTLENYGNKRNCSFSIINPEAIQIIDLNVGETQESPVPLRETGTIYKCQSNNRQDYVQLLDGQSINPDLLWQEAEMCGLNSRPSSEPYLLGCKHSVVRLVSSGAYYNSVTFSFRRLTSKEEIATMSYPDVKC